MSRHVSPLKLAVALNMLALSACNESTAPTQSKEQASQAAAATAGYLARDLNVPSRGEAGSATSINAAGQVVGSTFGPDDTWRGFIWRSGITTHLGTLGGRETQANDINDNGQVVGSSLNLQGKWRAFRLRNGIMTGLGSLGGRESRAFAINNKDDVVGQSQLSGNLTSHAFLVKNGVMTDLDTLGGANSAALDINDAGQIVGWSETSNGTRRPFLWQNGVMRDLLSPGSASVTGTAYAINSVGAVVGVRNHRAFRYYNGVMHSLGALGTGRSAATGIGAGRIVGGLDTPTGQRGFVFSNGQVTLLPLLPGGDRNAARAINGAGVIVGSTTLFDSNQPPTMWTPQ
jgi:probable HAF family extracellular repeat protein